MLNSRVAGASCLAGCLLLSSRAALAEPSLGSTLPQAVVPGATTDVKLRGGALAGATQVWTSFGGENLLTPDIADNNKNAAEVTWRFNVPATTPVGIHGLRVATADGVSALKLILVDDLPSVAQAGNNTLATQAQELTLPVAVDGNVGNQTRNYYRFKAEAGQKVSIEVVARRLGSPLDPLLRVLDATGHEVAASDDAAGLIGDSRVCVNIPAAGDYTIEVRDIRHQGGVYRLRVGDFPCVSVPQPMAVQRGQTAKVSLAGPAADDVAPVDVTVPADYPLDWISVGSKRQNGKSSGFATLRVSQVAVIAEAEPNNEMAKATRLEAGQTASGQIDAAGDIDHFVFAATKGQNWTFRALTQRTGAPTNVFVRLLNAQGGQVAVKEDYGVGDAAFDFAIPADGDYFLAVEELHRRGGAGFGYVVEMTPNTPGFELAASVHTINLGVRGTSMVTVTSTRRNYGGPITVAAVDLPPGVVSNPTVIGPGMNTTVLTLTSQADAPLNAAAPIRITGTAKMGEADFTAVAVTDDALKAGFNALPWAPQTLAKNVVLGVAAAKPQIRVRAEPAEAVFAPQLSATVKIIVDRDQGFDEVVNLALTPEAAKGGLPGNVTVELKPVAKGTNEIEAVFKGTDKAPKGDFTAVLTATIKQGNTTVTQVVPGITLRLKDALTVTSAPAADKVAAGSELKVKVTVERNPALQGEVTLTFNNLPKGVTAAAAKIPAEASEVEVALTAAADAQKGAAAGITVKAEVMANNVKFEATSAPFGVTVE